MNYQKIKKQIVELYRQTSCNLPKDVEQALLAAYKKEKSPQAKNVLSTILANIKLARSEKRPLCQDTGIPLFYVQYQRKKYSHLKLKRAIKDATNIATKEVPLRPNAIDFATGKAIGNYPIIYFKESNKNQITLLLKGGGSENVSAVYQLPNPKIGAKGRDLSSVEKVVLHAVYKAQGKGCPPYIIGVAVCGNIEEAAYRAKNRHLKNLNEHNKIAKFAQFEKQLLNKVNALKIGPLGLGGNTTALSVKFSGRYSHPASMFVGVSLTCWALRRRTLKLS
ncbi:MAG: fumarate hydratase [Patescibacteria group bacterium]|jgi:tartrate/fumarate subfamily iron-sulfur-dependent hydro-lyase alpha chain